MNASDVLLGDGMGFGAATTYVGGGSPASVTTADVNGDGKLDLVVAGLPFTIDETGAVDVLLGDGIGAFSPIPPRGRECRFRSPRRM